MVKRVCLWAFVLGVYVVFGGCELPPPPCDVTSANDKMPTPPANFAPGPRAKRVLVLSMTSGWRHGSIKAGVAGLQTLLKDAQLEVVATEDRSAVTEAGLSSYGAVILLQTTGSFLGKEEGEAYRALLSFVAEGGGLLGLHAAVDAYRCGEYQLLFGGTFRSHPGNVRSTKCKVSEATHPGVSSLPGSFEVNDEIYLLYNFRADNKVVMTCRDHADTKDLPIAWHRTYGKGRIFYSGLGHTKEYWQDQSFLKKHVLPALEWTLRLR